ncbi:MAG: hypothetical protein ACOC93_04940 [Planctomycetota bacterium]
MSELLKRIMAVFLLLTLAGAPALVATGCDDEEEIEIQDDEIEWEDNGVEFED